MAIQGSHYEPVTDDLKEKFLELVASGYTRPEAAAALGASARQLRACCNPQSHRYDDTFAKEYARLTEPGGEHHAGLVERLRAAGIERAIRSSDRLLEKYSVIYDPDWEVHRPQSMQLNFNNVEQLAVVLPELDEQQLLELRKKIERKKQQKQLPPADTEAE